jgi:hypothetical protein
MSNLGSVFITNQHRVIVSLSTQLVINVWPIITMPMLVIVTGVMMPVLVNMCIKSAILLLDPL